MLSCSFSFLKPEVNKGNNSWWLLFKTCSHYYENISNYFVFLQRHRLKRQKSKCCCPQQVACLDLRICLPYHAKCRLTFLLRVYLSYSHTFRKLAVTKALFISLRPITLPLYILTDRKSLTWATTSWYMPFLSCDNPQHTQRLEIFPHDNYDKRHPAEIGARSKRYNWRSPAWR